MAKKPIVKEPVLEVTVSEEVLPLQDVITKELVKNNLTEAILSEMETTAAGLEITGIDDKIGYDSVNKLRIAAKGTRILASKICKAGREEAISIQKLWISKEREVVERIEKVEDALAAKQKIIDDQKDIIKQEKERIELARLSDRTARLTSYGMIYNQEDSSYTLEDIRMSVVSIKQYDDFTFSTLESAVKTKFLQIQEIKKQEDETKELAVAEAKRLAEENLQRQEELNKKQAELEAQQKAIEAEQLRQKQEAERLVQEREAAERAKKAAELAAIQKAKDELLKSRMSALFAIGLSQQLNNLSFKEIVIPVSELELMNNEGFRVLLEETTKQIVHIKERIEKERLAEQERIKKEAIAAEKQRAEAEAMAKELELEKARVKAQAEAEAVEIEKQRLAALMPDEQKLMDFLKATADILIPVFTTEDYVKYFDSISETRKSFLTHVYKNRPTK